MLHQELTGTIIKAALAVHNKLGYGFLEKVYHNAMLIELKKQGLTAESEKSIKVFYDGQEIGDYFADIIVNNKVIVEIKAIKELLAVHETQLVNYLKATDINVGLLLNFGPSMAFKRKIFEKAQSLPKNT